MPNKKPIQRKSAARKIFNMNPPTGTEVGAQILAQREAAVIEDELAADLRHAVADLRDEAADRRDQALDTQEGIAKTKADIDKGTEAQLREANERLVIATVHAQAMAESAEKAKIKMSYMAEHDFLTGLPNRALLSDRLAQAITLAQRRGKGVALLYLDLDHFKHINDSLGHPTGDRLLQSAAERLQSCVRTSDTVSRQGGDEFVVLLSEVEQGRDAVLIAEKLIAAMTRPHLIGGHKLHVTLSIGISLYPDDGMDAETLIRNADTAMYYAKESGRNDYKRFSFEMADRAVERQTVEEALRHALDEGELVVHYQPKVNLKTSDITGAEALLRWRRAGHNLTYPTQFISIAEDCGLILPIGKWILHEACRQMAEWLEAGLNLEQIAVNVSSVEFHSKDFLADIRAILKDTGLDPHHLELELTESGLMQDTELTTAILSELKALGVRIAIDDFGTGYSSLSYLRLFPIDTLKIDQSFVQDIDGGADETVIVTAIIAMGKSLKQRVVAEGIETAQQLAFLQEQGCAEGQGYLFSRPVDAKEFASLLKPDRC